MAELTLEALFTSKAGFNVPTATALQRGILRAAQGRPTGLAAADLQKYFGGVDPTVVPALIVLVCGVRSGKSLLAVCATLFCALTADLSRLPQYERARGLIVAPTTVNSVSTFKLLAGAIGAAPALRRLIASPAKKLADVTGDTITIKRESDGRLVDIVVVAAHRGGTTIRGTWLTSLVIEEVAFFGADELGYKVNAEELLRAAEARLVPGGQAWVISSPMGPQGLLHGLWKEHFGKPGRALIVHAPTLAMNDVTVNVETVEALRKRDPDAAAREFDAEFADADLALLSSAQVDRAMRLGGDLPREDDLSYVAAMDPATRGNSWTLVVATRARRMTDDGVRIKHVIALARQWTGSKTAPLSPNAVLKEQARILLGYGVTSAMTDQHSADANRDIARRHNLALFDRASTHGENVDLFTSLATKFADDAVELPSDPVVRADLIAIRKKVTSTISIVLPRTPDGRHADYAPSIARALATHVRDPLPVKVAETAEDAARKAKDKARARNKKIVARQKREIGGPFGWQKLLKDGH